MDALIALVLIGMWILHSASWGWIGGKWEDLVSPAAVTMAWFIYRAGPRGG